MNLVFFLVGDEVFVILLGKLEFNDVVQFSIGSGYLVWLFGILTDEQTFRCFAEILATVLECFYFLKKKLLVVRKDETVGFLESFSN